MVSSKERQRLAREFDQAAKAMERQKAALTRMTLMLTEASAALFEIAQGDDLGPDQANETTAYLRERAQSALDRMERIREQPAAATTDDGEESKYE